MSIPVATPCPAAPEVAQAVSRAHTTNEVLDAHDQGMREAAAAAGVATARTAAAGMYLGGDLAAILYTDDDDALYRLDMREDTPPMQVTPTILYSLISEAYDLTDPSVDKHAPFVFADTRTLLRCVKFAAAQAKARPADKTWATYRILSYRAGLSLSTYSPVLTESLASRYWLPDQRPLDDLLAWDEAFDHQRRSGTREAFSFLIDRAVAGGREERLLKAAAAAERYGAWSAQRGSTHAQCAAFNQAGILTDAHAAMTLLDPLLSDRNAIAGAITQVSIAEASNEQVRAVIVGEPGKLREGSQVLLFDAVKFGRKVEVTLRALDFIDGALVATLSPPRPKDENAFIVETARRKGLHLYLAPAPFLMVRRAPKNRRWTDTGPPRTRITDIPVDIALAGTPASD